MPIYMGFFNKQYTPAPLTVSGGTLTSDATYYYRTFTANGTFSVSGGSGQSLSTDLLIVGGGRAGGTAFVDAVIPGVTQYFGANGGGAGQVSQQSQSFASGSYSVTIGAGGVSSPAANGTNTSIGSFSAIFGGSGSGEQTGTAGNNGGSGNDGANYSNGGGGGGSTSNGGNATTTNGGNGGSGATIFSRSVGGGGGGGSSNKNNGGTAVNGGGAGGGNGNGTNATVNSGGGGGGAGLASSKIATNTGGNGGSGVVVVRYTRSQVGG